MCLGAIHWARISAIRYGFDITDAARLGFDDREFFRQFTLPAAERSIPETQLAREEALALAEEYLAMPGRRIYRAGCQCHPNYSHRAAAQAKGLHSAAQQPQPFP